MKKLGFMFLCIILVVTLAGCGKKQQSLEEMQQPMSPEDLSRIKTEGQVSQEVKSDMVSSRVPTAPVGMQQGVTTTTAAQKPEVKLEPLPPSGPYKPTSIEIQTALRNSGYYMGKVDGRIGPMSKKAIEEFQKANNLKADGKVGPKTWAVLSKYLNPPAPEISSKKSSKKAAR